MGGGLEAVWVPDFLRIRTAQNALVVSGRCGPRLRRRGVEPWSRSTFASAHPRMIQLFVTKNALVEIIAENYSIGSTFAFHGRQNIRRSIRFRTTQNALVVSGRCGPRLSFFLVWSAALRAPCPRSQCVRVPLSLGFPSGIIR